MPQEHRTELANRAVVLSPILRAVEVPVGIVPGLWPCGCYSGPEVSFGDIAMDVLQARFRVADNPGVADSSDPLGTATQSGWIASTSTRKL